MKITVGICTWNRAKLLDQTLSQMSKLKVRSGLEWEVLVVNNNCTDETDDVLARHSSSLPIRRLFEPKQGHSNARNCAVENASGELLIWTDDDVLVPENWLEEYYRAALSYSEAAYFGGPVRPWWEAQPPKWVQRHIKTIGGLWALLDFGEQVRPLLEREIVHGANMAFRIEVLRKHRFDPSLGHIGNCLQGEDDTTLQRELRRSGRWGVWIGTAPVQHFITQNRTTSQFVWDLLQTRARHLPRAKEDYTQYPSLMGYPRWLLRQYWRARFQSLIRFPFRDDRWLRSFIEAAELRGVLIELKERKNQFVSRGVRTNL